MTNMLTMRSYKKLVLVIIAVLSIGTATSQAALQIAGQYGPAMGHAMRLPGGGSFDVFRGVTAQLDAKGSARVVFNADTMQMAAGWTEGGVRYQGLPFTGGHGQFPSLGKAPVFKAPNMPGWAYGQLWDEPRIKDASPPLGPLPREWAKFRGWYLHDDQVIFSYTIGEAAVLDAPRLVIDGDRKVIVRTLQITGDGQPKQMLVATDKEVKADGTQGTVGKTAVCLAGAPKGASLKAVEGRLVLSLPGSKEMQRFQIALWSATEKPAYDAVTKAVGAAADLTPLTKGGSKRWTKGPIKTKGKVAADSKAAYALDKISLPPGRPYGSQMRIGGFDFFADGKSAAISTWSGDVWIVSGIDDKLENVTWKKFAGGLHEPLGLKIVNDVIYTVADDQITRFHDFNKDGEADFYETFNNDWDLTSGFHAFCFDLHTDPKGNFYFAFGSPVRGGGRSFERMGRHHGSIIRVSADGKKMVRYASGLRAPNGMCVGPDGRVTCGDNEGTFVPRCPIHWVDEGDFLGVVDSAENFAKMKTTPTVGQRTGGRKRHLESSEAPKPLAWLPKDVDNSGGGQAWVTSDKWGPLKGEMLHMSYGRSSLYLVLKEKQGNQMQGGVVKFPLRFTSSTMRARFNPADGQLYVTGLRGWQTNAAKMGGFDRVRYTGNPLTMPIGLKTNSKGVEITFAQPLDKNIAGDADSYSVTAADIRWTHAYGSGDYKLGGRDGKPTKGGRTELQVESAKVSADGKTVVLEIEDFQPAHQMRIEYDIKTADGKQLRDKIWNTVHVVPK